MTNRQFFGLCGLLMLNSALLFYLINHRPLMWGFGVMSAMMFLPVLAYGCARIMVAVSAWSRSHKRRRHGHHWFDDDGDSTES